MKYSAFMLAVLFIGTVAQAKTQSQVHQEICEIASEAYPNDIGTVDECLATTETESTPAGFDVSFANCNTGEFITFSWDESTGEITEGSSGLEDDACGN